MSQHLQVESCSVFWHVFNRRYVDLSTVICISNRLSGRQSKLFVREGPGVDFHVLSYVFSKCCSDEDWEFTFCEKNDFWENLAPASV